MSICQAVRITGFSHEFNEGRVVGALTRDLDSTLQFFLSRLTSRLAIVSDYTGATTNLEDVSAGAVDESNIENLLPAGLSVGDAIYIGHASGVVGGSLIFNGCQVRFATTGAGTINGIWEYAASDETWKPLQGVVDGTNQFRPATTGLKAVSWTVPTDALRIPVNNVWGGWVRFRVTSVTGATAPTGNVIYLVGVTKTWSTNNAIVQQPGTTATGGEFTNNDKFYFTSPEPPFGYMRLIEDNRSTVNDVYNTFYRNASGVDTNFATTYGPNYQAAINNQTETKYSVQVAGFTADTNGVSSVNQIGGDGFLQAEVTSLTTNTAIALTNVGAAFNATDTNQRFMIRVDAGTAKIYESGILVGTPQSVSVGDKISIWRTNGYVYYKVNFVLMYRSVAANQTGTLEARVFNRSANSSLTNVRFGSGARLLWQPSPETWTVQGNSTKTALAPATVQYPLWWLTTWPATDIPNNASAQGPNGVAGYTIGQEVTNPSGIFSQSIVSNAMLLTTHGADGVLAPTNCTITAIGCIGPSDTGVTTLQDILVVNVNTGQSSYASLSVNEIQSDPIPATLSPALTVQAGQQVVVVRLSQSANINLLGANGADGVFLFYGS